MPEQSSPNTDSVPGIAWEITKSAYGSHSFTDATPDEIAKQIANTYAEVYRIISTEKPEEKPEKKASSKQS